MISSKTVFLLGAGASWHYGFPTGLELVRRVRNHARDLAEYVKNHPAVLYAIPKIIEDRIAAQRNGDPNRVALAWNEFGQRCRQLSDRLMATNTPVIDTFLGQNPDLSDIGKLLIAVTILEAEAKGLLRSRNPNRPATEQPKPDDDWCRFVVHRMTNGCCDTRDLLASDVHFVTFNYDISLEYRIYEALSNTQLFSSIAEDFLESGRVIHVYGSIRDYPKDKIDNPYAKFADRDNRTIKENLDAAYESSQRLRTISPGEKADGAHQIRRAKQLLDSADEVYLLGFGFDENNCDLLDMDKNCDLTNRTAEQEKSLYFTNMGNHPNINRAASRLFLKTRSDLVGDHAVRNNASCQKSVRNVYDALQKDFF